jgi:uncharacterized SAM-binding protein YcdF (DUF218 family)
MVRTAVAVVGTGGAACLVAAGWVVRSARRLPPLDAVPRPALVLGCPPGPGLDRRVDRAVRLWRAGLVTRLVISGAGEAAHGVARALAAGVPAHAVSAEPHARSTRDNVRLARPLLGADDVWIVSDDWHLPRACVLARRAGLRPRPVPAASPRRARHLLREAVCVVRTVVDPE